MSEDMEKRLKKAEKEIETLKRQLNDRDEIIRNTFGPYMTDEVLEDVVRRRGQISIGGERCYVSMMFTDLRRSTELSEMMDPLQFIDMLNHYMCEMIDIINAWQGNILDFVGDAIVVVFGAPRKNEQSARDAVACAVSMQRRMDAVNEWNRERGYPDISMGIGIHCGDAILGNIGSQIRRKYDMIGRNVNLASRIEGFSKGGQILVSTEIMESAGDLVVENPEGRRMVQPKGISEEIMIHEVIGYGNRFIPGEEDKGHD